MTVDTLTADTFADITHPLSHPRLTAIPAFADNYIWALTSADGSCCLVVDPGDADAVTRWLADKNCTLTAILVTHHHADHTGGIQALRSPGVTVYGPRHENIDGIDVTVGEGDRVRLDDVAVTLSVLDVPGHTRGHVAYHGTVASPVDEARMLFCGDTLFSAGCGRLFEGTAADMHASLSRLAALPADTLVCCAHEYTLGNLRFAQAVEPGNADVTTVTAWARARRDAGAATVPSSIARELRINPFLRTQYAGVIEAAARQGAADNTPPCVFSALRRWKDGFR